MNKYLVVSVIATDRPGIANELTTVATDHNCNIIDSNMAVLGSEFSVMMLITGSWNSIAKFETALSALEQKLDLLTIVKRTEQHDAQIDLLPYAIEVVSLDNPGIIKDISTFFSTQSINIEHLQTDSFKAPHTAAPMLVVNMTVNIPANVHIADLRENFTLFCDDLNLDASMEPIKGHL